MKTWQKVMIGVVGAMTIGAGANVVGLAVATPQSPPNVVDVKGNCDEPEHVNDPECEGPQVPEDNDGIGAAQGGQVAGNDVSGPCDEAEHANDPECQAGGAAGDRDDGQNDDREDNSGPSGEKDEDNSGPSDNSGSSNDDDEGNSGPSDDSDDDDGSDDRGSGHGSDDGPGHDSGDDHGGHGDDN